MILVSFLLKIKAGEFFMISIRVARSPQQEYKIPFSLEASYSIPHRARHNPQNPAGLFSCLSPEDLQNPNSTITMTPLHIPPHRVQKLSATNA
jgi:hypothetical protein